MLRRLKHGERVNPTDFSRRSALHRNGVRVEPIDQL